MRIAPPAVNHRSIAASKTYFPATNTAGPTTGHHTLPKIIFKDTKYIQLSKIEFINSFN